MCLCTPDDHVQLAETVGWRTRARRPLLRLANPELDDEQGSLTDVLVLAELQQGQPSLGGWSCGSAGAFQLVCLQQEEGRALRFWSFYYCFVRFSKVIWLRPCNKRVALPETAKKLFLFIAL